MAAPELVPGSMKASIRNNASGLITDTNSRITPTTDVPTAEKPSPSPVAMPVVN